MYSVFVQAEFRVSRVLSSLAADSDYTKVAKFFLERSSLVLVAAQLFVAPAPYPLSSRNAVYHDLFHYYRIHPNEVLCVL